MKRKLLMNYEILMNQNYGIAAEMAYVVQLQNTITSNVSQGEISKFSVQKMLLLPKLT